MRVSFFNEKGNLEVRECEGIEVDAKQFDFSQSKGDINVKLMLSNEEQTWLRVEDEKAYDYLKMIDDSVEKGVAKFGKDDARVVERYDRNMNSVYHEMSEMEKELEEVIR